MVGVAAVIRLTKWIALLFAWFASFLALGALSEWRWWMFVGPVLAAVVLLLVSVTAAAVEAERKA